MFDMEQQRLPLPVAADFMTRHAAAVALRCTSRTVDRLVDDGVLTGYHPISAPDELRPPLLLASSQVREVADARKLLMGRTP